MATYAIGDVQGCFATFCRLLEQLAFVPGQDRLWLVGDVVNRGPQSLEMLRWLVEHDSHVTCVLGNHDLHLLGVALGHRRLKGRDTLQPILDAPDRDDLLDWLRRRPLLHAEGDWVLVHAGLHPSWSLEEAERGAHAVGGALCSGTGDQLFLHPDREVVAAARALVAMRVVNAAGDPDLAFKGGLADVPSGSHAWFRAPDRCMTTHTVLFGHWSMLGLHLADGVVALDTGCVWGGSLTALRLEDRSVTQVAYAEATPSPKVG